MKFVATKKVMTTTFFSPLSFVAVFGSGIRDPGWVKIRIRDNHPGSATLQKIGGQIRKGKKFLSYPVIRKEAVRNTELW